MEVVDFLNDLWTVFDDIINKFNVYKVRARVSFPALCGLQLAILATFCQGFALFFLYYNAFVAQSSNCLFIALLINLI